MSVLHHARLLLALTGFAASTLACGEAPSYQLGWRIADASGLAEPDSVPALRSVQQCSEVGVSLVEVEILDGDGALTHLSRYPCLPGPFAKGELVDGPTLEPGHYTLNVIGLRRNGEDWTCEEDAETCVAQASASVDVAEGQLPKVEVLLLAPPQCDDGVDNDHDGRVDDKDRACQLDAASREDSDRGAVIFQLSTTLLDSPVVLPTNVRINYLQISVDGEEIYRVADNGDIDLTLWPFRVQLFSVALDPGVHTLSVTGLGGEGTADAPLTQTLSRDFVVDAEQGAYVIEQFDFGAGQFLTPIEDRFYLYMGELPYPGVDESLVRTCLLLNEDSVDALRLRVRDEAQQILDAATSGLDDLGGVDVADGWIELPCQTANFGSGILPWGNYTLEAQGLIDGEVCWDRLYHERIGPSGADPAPVAPLGGGSAQRLFLQRVVDDQGQPPAACVECQADGDCFGSTNLRCENGLCVHN